LPSDDEWTSLAKAVGGTGTYGQTGTAGKALKSTSGWNGSGNGLNTYGFNGLPIGKVLLSPNASLNSVGQYSMFWTRTAEDATRAIRRSLNYNDNYLSRDPVSKNDNAFGVRCVKD